eukprot:comp19322_c0_seq3/m.22210 comp19322_c0_seq3/g.22210  ORF comp19322_c0_seq3/g.22210 comp19322_c0_seq3/m.22210 type:complete len:344 (-) comp19322_c0_seq3:632-1663(-)
MKRVSTACMPTCFSKKKRHLIPRCGRTRRLPFLLGVLATALFTLACRPMWSGLTLLSSTSRLMRDLTNGGLHQSFLPGTQQEYAESTRNETEQLPTIYFITPTYKRHSQKADLTRLSHTLAHVARLHWIVIEDAKSCSSDVTAILERSGVYRWSQIHARSLPKSQNWNGHRGVNQRNAGMKKAMELSLLNDNGNGIIYFGDDDNAYDLQLFDAIRSVRKVGTWAIGFTGGRLYERCVVDPTTGYIKGFVTNWHGGRKFPVDMGAFAINMQMLHRQRALGKDIFMIHKVRNGYLETKFLELFVRDYRHLEPKGNCTKVWVWHTKTMLQIEGKPPEGEPDEPLDP